MTQFYSITRFFQNGEEFQCSWDLSVAIKEQPTDQEAMTHLSSILQENWAETWGREDADSPILDLQSLSPIDFARKLVLSPEESGTLLKTTWEISTNWDEVETANYEHPSNL